MLIRSVSESCLHVITHGSEAIIEMFYSCLKHREQRELECVALSVITDAEPASTSWTARDCLRRYNRTAAERRLHGNDGDKICVQKKLIYYTHKIIQEKCLIHL